MNTLDGSYYTFSGQRPRAEGGEPVQPKARFTVGEANLDGLILEPRGVVFRGAVYRDIEGFTPLIERAGILDAPDRGDAQQPPAFNAPGWYPLLPVSLRRLERMPGTGPVLVGRSEAQLLFYVGQYHADRGTERLFEEITVDEYYSASTDREAPTIESVEARMVNGTTELVVQASDPSGIDRVVVAYTEEQGSWESVDLTREASGAWQGRIPVDATYIVQAVDKAGNVAAGCSRVEDVNGDSRVDVVDIMAVASRWRAAMGDADYKFTSDIDRDWDIDIVDVMLAAAAWGARCGG